jgi:hypothetical protein
VVVYPRTSQPLAVVALVVASSLTAQPTRRPAPTTDSSASSQAPDRWPHRAWISGGLGLGTWPYGSLAGIISGWYSGGAVAIGVRAANVGQWFGEQRSDRAFLVGARTRGNHGFLLGALGAGQVSSSRTCDGPCTGLTRPSASALTYSVEAHGNLEIAGVGLTMFGALGAASTRYNAFALTLNFGWFGP